MCCTQAAAARKESEHTSPDQRCLCWLMRLECSRMREPCLTMGCSAVGRCQHVRGRRRYTRLLVGSDSHPNINLGTPSFRTFSVLAPICAFEWLCKGVLW